MWINDLTERESWTDELQWMDQTCICRLPIILWQGCQCKYGQKELLAERTKVRAENSDK